MKSDPKIRPVLGIAIVLVLLAGLILAGWWLFRKAYALSGSLETSSAFGMVTALACTALIVWAIHRGGAFRAARLRGRAEAYEAAITLVLRTSERSLSRAEWRRVHARLLLWGSSRVISEFADLQGGPWAPDNKEPVDWTRLEALLQAMRSDLGQGAIRLEIGESPEEDAD